jgi:putative transposase
VFGVEPICRVLSEHGLPIAPSTYYEALGRPPSARALRDEQLRIEIGRVHQANYGVYGARKVWMTLARQDMPVARCTVERLMAELSLSGARRGKKKRTTIADPQAVRAGDLVGRKFDPKAPNVLWVADFTYVSTWSGWVYVAFVIDAYARRIVGWRTATTMNTRLVLDAIEHAIWTRGREGITDLSGLIHHHDRGSQGGLNRSSQHLKMMEVFDGTTSATGGSGSAAGDALTRAADPGQACGTRVLAADCTGHAHRRCGQRDRRVCPGRGALVSSRWRYAALEPCRARGPLSGVRRT